MTFGIAYWLLVAVLVACVAIIAVTVVREWVLPWYRKRRDANHDNILADDLIEDDISIILSGTVTQKDLNKTINLLKEVSVAVKRTERKVTALEKIKQHKVNIEEGKKKIEQLTTEIKSTS